MRPTFALLLLAALAGPSQVSAHGDHAWPPGNHSPNVAGFFWEPQEPARGQLVRAKLSLREPLDLEAVAVKVCRVENFACRNLIEMTDLGRNSTLPQYGADVPWDGRFYKGVTQVGIALILQFSNGTAEESPVAPWPEARDLPDGAGNYYFYDLPPEPPSLPSVGPVPLVLAAAFALVWRRK